MCPGIEGYSVADAHCDLLGKRQKGVANVDVTPETIKTGGVALQTFAAFVNSHRAGDMTAGLYMAQARDFHVMIAEYGLIHGIPVVLDSMEPHAILAVEGGEAFAGSIERIAEYADLGMLMCNLTWNHENELGFPHGQRGGLKPFGLKAVKELARLKCAVDVSHLNEDGFWQVMETGAHVLASHSCCRTLCAHSRNLTDEQIRALSEGDGYIGVNFYPLFLTENSVADRKSVVDHINHFLNVAGRNIVGFGSDFDGIERKPVGLENPASFGSLIDGIILSGMPDSAVKSVTGDAFLRFLRSMRP